MRLRFVASLDIEAIGSLQSARRIPGGRAGEKDPA
jgi:hypothetical protein